MLSRFDASRSLSLELPGVQVDYLAWERKVCSQAVKTRLPISGSLSLTNKCNLRCVHCYLQNSRDVAEISTQAWLDIIDQVEHAGCLWLLLTGGEPLVRKDFPEIYMHAIQKGMLVTVFTNATLVDDAVVDLWSKWPPFAIEVSLYGFTEETYRRVTGSSQAKHKCFEAVERLIRKRLPVRLKSMLLQQNAGELARLEEYCKNSGIHFRSDPIVSPTQDGCTKPCESQCRLDTISDFYLQRMRKRPDIWMNQFHKIEKLPERKKLFSCGAGKASFNVFPNGRLSLCILDKPLYDLTCGTFKDGWNGVCEERGSLDLPENHPCLGCRLMMFCSHCAPMAKMETGSEYGFSERLCKITRECFRIYKSCIPKHLLKP